MLVENYCFTFGNSDMSLVGKKPIPVPSNTSVTINAPRISVKGPKGELEAGYARELTVELKDSVLYVTRDSDLPRLKALHGLWRSLISNMVVGVSEGFEKKLELIGTGYRAQQKGKDIEFSLGFSHSVVIKPLGTNELVVEAPNWVAVKGNSRETVGEQAARIRRLRPPNPFTGKGVKYQGEVIRRKAGKAAGAKGE